MKPFSDLSDALRRRERAFRLARLVVLALVIVYFFLPYDVQSVIPVWLLFLAALGLEVEFFLGGYLRSRRGVAPPEVDRGPQPRDLADLGAREEELEGPPLFPPAWYGEPSSEPAAAPRRPYWRYVAEALAGLTIVTAILFYASRPHGWDAIPAADQEQAESLFSQEAALIAGHPAQIKCDTRGEYVGFVQDADGAAEVGGDQAYLTPSICDTLYQLAFKQRVQSFSRTARALAVLAHEAWHLYGVRDEGLTNCYGFQSGVELGEHLGLTESAAREMMREQLATHISDAAGKPQYLVPSGCRDGGRHDLNPAAPGFP